MFRPRPKQQDVLNYTGGRMGVSAVPGSGKTVTLSALAAGLVAGDVLEDDQEVLIVTLVNSAVDNFAGRVGSFIQERGLLPNLGYRVRTLHGLAHDIVHERPALVGLSDGFQIVDERAADQIRQGAVETWLRENPRAADRFLSPELEEGKLKWVRRTQWPDLVGDIARSFIRRAKDLQVTPGALRDCADNAIPMARRASADIGRSSADELTARLIPFSDATEEDALSLVEMGWAIYRDYQRALTYRGAVDFDDLIRLALRALQLDAEFLQRLRHCWPFILEDEAQDSSRLQERILQLLTGPDGNWVRVGDPNQAIYETFTTADPRLLRRFLNREDVEARELPNSGRSTQSIMSLANALIDWTQHRHPVEAEVIRNALTPPHIKPAPPGDPQPNPPDDAGQVHLIARKYTPAEELQAVVDSLARWLPEHPEETVAVLVPRNRRGFEVVGELKKRDLDYVEFLRSTRATREAAGALGNIVNYLADPSSSKKLARVYQVWRREDRGDADARPRLEAVTKALRHCRRVEDFLWPRVDRDWLDGLDVVEGNSEVGEQLAQFRMLARRWQEAALLPIDQLILTLAQDLFKEPADLAVAHKLAVVLRRASESHPDWRLPELTQELAVVARNERRFLSLSEDDVSFDPEQYKGQVVVTTAHKAKGLEWDRVYLMSVNNYNFPSAQPHDTFISEKWFVRDRLNLEAEALAQLEVADIAADRLPPTGCGRHRPPDRLPDRSPDCLPDCLQSTSAAPVETMPLQGEGGYEEGRATREARLDYAAERLRLLYVCITRARKDLVITWNTGRRGDRRPATPFVALRTFWENRTS